MRRWRNPVRRRLMFGPGDDCAYGDNFVGNLNIDTALE